MYLTLDYLKFGNSAHKKDERHAVPPTKFKKNETNLAGIWCTDNQSSVFVSLTNITA